MYNEMPPDPTTSYSINPSGGPVPAQPRSGVGVTPVPHTPQGCSARPDERLPAEANFGMIAPFLDPGATFVPASSFLDK